MTDTHGTAPRHPSPVITLAEAEARCARLGADVALTPMQVALHQRRVWEETARAAAAGIRRIERHLKLLRNHMPHTTRYQELTHLIAEVVKPELLDNPAAPACPVPFPGPELAEPRAGGGWERIPDVNYNLLPELPGEACAPLVYSPQGYTRWMCTAHLPGWHVATVGESYGRSVVVAVWPDGGED